MSLFENGLLCLYFEIHPPSICQVNNNIITCSVWGTKGLGTVPPVGVVRDSFFWCNDFLNHFLNIAGYFFFLFPLKFCTAA